jgi:VIT1/CCC1 family predicted Fe2+/Mn2+ transporter
VFGYVKALVFGNPKRIISALQMTITGVLAGAAAYFIAGLIPQESLGL